MTYPQVVEFGNKAYLGFLDGKKLTRSIEVGGGVGGKEIQAFLDADYIGRAVALEIKGTEFTVRDLTDENKIIYDAYTAAIKQAETIAPKRLVIKEANNIYTALK